MGDRSDSPGPLRYRLWAGGLFKDISDDEVRKKMGKFGEVVDVRIRSSARDTFAFIQFTNQKAIDTAIEKMDNSSSLGDRVRVAQATENNKKRSDEDSDGRDDSRASSPRRLDRGDSRDRRGGRRGDRGRSDLSDRRHRRGGPRGYRDRDDSRDCGRGAGRCGRRGRDDYSPPPRGRRDGRDERHRQRSRSRDGVVRMAGKVPVGRHKVTIEHLPEDMTWLELKDLGRDYGPSLTFARTYRQGGAYYGMLEFKDRGHADRVIGEMNNRRVQGSKERLRAYYGPGPGGD
uniref:RRM domain-containing protein n=1 Tax=Alexandrium catenella TaxID=2925 RepID=A0A7S1WBZ8_ALECA|mmetsp:Transcript_47926/g.128233  ORF Transcript_47926/g.128233 Transcript_47926/m.128233 type:complete len:288 (+) Transcript_47926:194-1057(+)